MNSNHDFEAERERVERWLDDVDLYVRGELSSVRTERLETASREDSELSAMISDARASLEAFAPAREMRCPEALTNDILAAVDQDVPAVTTSRRSPAPRRPAIVSPAFGWTAAAAAVIALWALIGPGLPFSTVTGSEPTAFVANDGTSFSEDQIRAATQQMGLAMSVLNRTMDRTGSLVRTEFSGEIHDHVTVPLREGFGRSVRSIPYLNPQPRDDEHSGTVSPPSVDGSARSRLLEGALSGERT